MGLCKRCHRSGEFYVSRPQVCKSCIQAQNEQWRQANMTKVRARSKARYRALPELDKDYRRLQMRARMVGISAAELREIESLQDGRCAICGGKQRSLHMHIDHCHATDSVRAVLCRDCNHLLGNAHDSIEILQKAIDYLNAHRK